MPYRDSYGPGLAGPRLTPWVTRLLIALTAVFLALFIADDLLRLGVTGRLVFAPAMFLQQPWSVLTFPFVHRWVFGIFFVLLTLYFFGGQLEDTWGGPQFLKFIAVSALGSVLLSVILAAAFPGMRLLAVSGVEGPIYGMLLAFAMLWPEMQLNIWGIIPVKAKWLALGAAVIGFIVGVQGGGSGLAHLGAFGTAFLYLRSPWAPRAWGDVPVKKAKKKPQQTALVPWSQRREQPTAPTAAAPRPAATGARRTARAEKDLLDDVDRILDKISAQGLSSLTEDERKRLDEVSRRYRTN